MPIKEAIIQFYLNYINCSDSYNVYIRNHGISDEDGRNLLILGKKLNEDGTPGLNPLFKNILKTNKQ